MCFEDVGYILCCEVIIFDVFGRFVELVYIVIVLVILGFFKIESFDIEGCGFYIGLYVVCGIYSGGKEGKSMF